MTPTSSVFAAFEAVGTLTRDNPGQPPGVWVLVYETAGAPALGARLVFTAESKCRSLTQVLRCDDLQVGARVRVEGEDLDGHVRVATLEVLGS
jgi:hypothetical protein